jgi:prophage maintenance system killer protein
MVVNFNTIKQNVTVAQAQLFLEVNGLQLTIEQTKNVVDYLYQLATKTLTND